MLTAYIATILSSGSQSGRYCENIFRGAGGWYEKQLLSNFNVIFIKHPMLLQHFNILKISWFTKFSFTHTHLCSTIQIAV